MKRFKDFIKESNVSSGIGIRGLGNVTGEPAIDSDVVSNYIQNNIDYSDQLKDNMTDGLYGLMDDNWWMNRKEMKSFTKKAEVKSISEGMEKNHYEAIDDIHVNLDNRNHAIEDYGYGPMNPNLENREFWKKKAELWKNTPKEAMKSKCGNCAAFNRSEEILRKISENLGPAGKKITDMAGLGFCEMFHFKCAAERTCDAWLVNGPIKEEAPANAAGSGNIAGLGGPVPEGKPANWSEPPVSSSARKRHKKNNEKQSEQRTTIIDMLRRTFPNMVGTK